MENYTPKAPLLYFTDSQTGANTNLDNLCCQPDGFSFTGDGEMPIFQTEKKTKYH